jgi:hypothetical protein
LPRIAIVMVAAVAENGVIGRGNALPWRLSSDLQRFRAITMNKPVLMGRKTFASIGKPLDGRTNIVVTRDRSFAARSVVSAPSVEAARGVARGGAVGGGAGSGPVGHHAGACEAGGRRAFSRNRHQSLARSRAQRTSARAKGRCGL